MVNNIFLGTDFRVVDDKIEMEQRRYCEKLLERFNMPNCNPRATPFSDVVTDKTDESSPFSNARKYQELCTFPAYLCRFSLR